MGTQKNRLNETVLLSTQNICYKLWVRKYIQFYVENLFVGIEAVKKESKKLKYNFEVQHVVSP